MTNKDKKHLAIIYGSLIVVIIAMWAFVNISYAGSM